jgi:thymidine kinase
MGHLKVIIGCMFANKTTELLRCAREYKKNGKNVLLINHSSDTRYGEDCLKTHDGDYEFSTSAEYLRDINIKNYQVVVIDEGQFFSDLFTYVTLWADTLDVKIIVAGLSGNSQREPIGDILRLIPHADEIQHLKANCSFCGESAIYSKFTGIGIPGVGGSESYIQVCRSCR